MRPNPKRVSNIEMTRTFRRCFVTTFRLLYRFVGLPSDCENSISSLPLSPLSGQAACDHETYQVDHWSISQSSSVYCEIIGNNYGPTLTIQDACAMGPISSVHLLAPDFAIFTSSLPKRLCPAVIYHFSHQAAKALTAS
jgi:hypothetical protein